MAAAIWVDADACPGAVREILCRAAERTAVVVTFVANQALQLPRSPYIRQRQVSAGFDIADDEIVRLCNQGDLVVTSDIPLAAEVLAKGAEAVSPRGEPWKQDSIKARLQMRDFMDTLRSSGIQSGGPSALGAREIKSFADVLDRWLVRQRQAGSPSPPVG